MAAVGWTRRRFLAAGLGGGAAVVVGAYELVDHGILPGEGRLHRLEGACSVSTPHETFRSEGPTVTGRYRSRARGREVVYTIAYPPDHGPGDRLPFAFLLHGNNGDHTSNVGRGVTPARALAGTGIPPFAIVAPDGGNLYWNPHPGDDPAGMLVHELIPMCRRRGLGVDRGTIGALGISMGGYGVLLLAQAHPGLLAAVAAISPAIWTSYSQALAVNRSAFASAEDFARDDVITHAARLERTPVRIASGHDDPFRPGVEKLVAALGPHATVQLTGGCHDGAFFASQQRQSLQFLARHMAA